MNAPTINIANLRVACSSCNLRELCLPVGLSLTDIEKLADLAAPATASNLCTRCGWAS
jgi:CRP/FNR family transcriptional regulator